VLRFPFLVLPALPLFRWKSRTAFTDWFETGFYVFTGAAPSQGRQWVGDHIRPQVRIPASWKWPVGVSLSTEIGYQRSQFSADTWTWEIRPIIDQKKGRATNSPGLTSISHQTGSSISGWAWE